MNTRTDLAELRRLLSLPDLLGDGGISQLRFVVGELLDELEAAREENASLKQDLDGFKPVGGDFIRATKLIGAAEELEQSAKTLREDLADMNPPEFASRGKVAPGYCECLQDVADGMEERAAKLRQEAEDGK